MLGGLQSNYLKRVAHQLPRQGGEHPWRNRQDYYHDSKVLLKEAVDTAELQFVKAVKAGVQAEDRAGLGSAAEAV